MLLLSEHDVERLIDPRAAIQAALEAYRQHSAGGVLPPGRLDMRRDDPKGSVLVLAGHSRDGLFAAKTNAHVYPDATSRRRKAASLMAVWDMRDCMPLALIATTGFNNHRTASGFAAATQLLAAPGAEVLAVFGAGKIAPAVIRYLAEVRPLKRVLIVGRGPERATALADTVRRWAGFSHIAIEAMLDAAEVARQADIIVTVTTSDIPVFPGHAVKPGTFVILGGANRPDAREADDDFISRARIYADHLEGCMARAGDICIPFSAGKISREQVVGEIGAFTPNTNGARAGDITAFKSMGIVAQDLALAKVLIARAEKLKIGAKFDMIEGAMSIVGAPPEVQTNAAHATSLEATK